MGELRDENSPYNVHQVSFQRAVAFIIILPDVVANCWAWKGLELIRAVFTILMITYLEGPNRDFELANLRFSLCNSRISRAYGRWPIDFLTASSFLQLPVSVRVLWSGLRSHWNLGGNQGRVTLPGGDWRQVVLFLEGKVVWRPDRWLFQAEARPSGCQLELVHIFLSEDLPYQMLQPLGLHSTAVSGNLVLQLHLHGFMPIF